MILGEELYIRKNKVICVEINTDSIERKILRILYVWRLDYLGKFMSRQELKRRLRLNDDNIVGYVVKDLKEKKFVEVVPPVDSDWGAIRITKNGIDVLKMLEII